MHKTTNWFLGKVEHGRQLSRISHPNTSHHDGMIKLEIWPRLIRMGRAVTLMIRWQLTAASQVGRREQSQRPSWPRWLTSVGKVIGRPGEGEEPWERKRSGPEQGARAGQSFQPCVLGRAQHAPMPLASAYDAT
jgi:hypothetical protein